MGTSGGAEAAVLAVRLAATKAGMGAFALDTSAAFQHIRRQRAFEAAKKYQPQFEPFLRAWYSEGAEHRWRDGTGRNHRITAEGGFDQRDPMEPLACALATGDMLEAIQRRLRNQRWARSSMRAHRTERRKKTRLAGRVMPQAHGERNRAPLYVHRSILATSASRGAQPPFG